MMSTTTELPLATGRRLLAAIDGRRSRRILRRGAVLAILALALTAATSRGHQVAAVGHDLVHLRWGWLVAALGLEALSMVVFARIQQRLLRAGSIDVGLGSMTAITLAGNALALSVPGGVAWGATWVFRQLRRHGADRLVAGWVVLMAGALGSFALFVVLATGVEIAGSRGPMAHLREPMAALAALPALAVAAILVGRGSGKARDAARRAVGPAARHLSAIRGLADHVAALAARVGAVKLGTRGWMASGALAVLNWLGDCACLMACIWAVGGSVPWRGVLVAYALGQVAASLPVVPGGVGVVEGSLSVLLVAYGMPADSTVAAVLLYRVVSFWAVVPVGWGTWVVLALRDRRHGEGDRVPIGQRPVPIPGPATRLEPAA